MGSNRRQNNDGELDLGIEDEILTEEPKQYKVLMHNDDYTPMDFVIYVLKKIFNKDEMDSHKIMLDVHNKGVGVAGVYSFEVAETKVMQANQFAKNNQYPLKTSFEEES
jgi:ATP-dependent Clp protease adaptor protein ClpS